MDIYGRQPLSHKKATSLHELDEPDLMVVCWHQLQKRYSNIGPFRHSGFPGNGGLDNVMKRFNATGTSLTLVEMFNLLP